MDKEELLAMRRKGMTLQQIANHFGVARQRIHEIIGNTGRLPRPDKKMSREAKDDLRLWGNIVKEDGENGCWLWTGTVLWNGYGRYCSGGKPRYAHIVVYEKMVGKPVGRLFRRCDNNHCVNPAHLVDSASEEYQIALKEKAVGIGRKAKSD